MKKSLLPLSIVAIAIVAGLWFYPSPNSILSEEMVTENLELTPLEWRAKELAQKKKRREQGYSKMDQPDEYVKFHKGIRTREGESNPGYRSNYKLRELKKAQSSKTNFRTHMLDWVSRGPGNVPGRTRAVLPLPSDPENNWIVGASGGGIWKTTNGGDSWEYKSDDFPSLAVTSLALVESNPDIIYAGTGEHIASAGTAIAGDGLFKSIDAGETWTQIASTSNNPDFTSVTRVIVDPQNEDILLAATAENTWDDFSQSQIMRSVNGGATWTKVYSSTPSIDQILFTPGDFNIQYATVNSTGVIKSVDAGLTWTDISLGLSPSGRIELAISPVTTDRIFASAQGIVSGTGSDLYLSDDAGATWKLVSDPGRDVDFLGGQGWYDNTIMASPFKDTEVYYAGVNVWKTTLSDDPASTTQVVNIDVDDAAVQSFWDVVGFSNGEYYRNGLSLGDSPLEDFVSVELRFGPGINQMAHRFTVPEGRTSSVEPENYTYQEYIEVPLQAWDIENNRQLMVSFRDQANDGVFNLIEENLSGGATEQSREYLYIHSIDYDASPSPDISIAGGIEINQLYFISPKLASGATWTPEALPDSKLTINFSTTDVLIQVGELANVSDAYQEFDNINTVFGNSDIYAFHPDHHALVAIPVDEAAGTYKIINGSDGGIYVSNTSRVPGTKDGDWTFKSFGYNTSQFYGADKKPGANEYIGGMQDQGTWKSPVGEDADDESEYAFSIGGDGFQVLWNSADPRKVIGGSQGNNFRRTLNDGQTWINATSGITGSSPFISKLANSQDNPNVIFTVTSNGVFRSDDFGGNWSLTPITSNFSGGSTFANIKVSLADQNTVWAGAGMTALNRLHVSINGGDSFSQTNNFTDATLGAISGLETHPQEKETAYALFSQAEGPKVLRTADLGQTWEDISGFGSGTVSNNGFPDVAVYSLLVMPWDPSIIWVGTEIGLFESIDNGASWQITDNGFPAASVWQMKVVDDQIVVATHGRGIWSLTIPELTATIPQIEVLRSGTTPKQEIIAEIGVDQPFDSIRVVVNNEEVGLLGENVNPVIYTIRVSGISEFGEIPLRMLAYKDGVEFKSFTKFVEYFEVGDIATKYENDFDTDVADFRTDGFQRRIQINGYTSPALHSTHPYGNNANHTALLLSPMIIGAEFPFITYNNTAIVQPGDPGAAFGDEAFKDYVVVEGSTDGINWISVEDGYDSNADAGWLDEFDTEGTGSVAFLQEEILNLSNSFSVGDTVFIRFRLFSDGDTDGYGWVIDDLYVQEEPLGIEDLEISDQFNMVLYPNPVVDDQVQIEFNLKNSSDVTIQVIDFSGRILEDRSLGYRLKGRHLVNKQVDLLPAGAYLIKLSTKGESITQRLIVQ